MIAWVISTGMRIGSMIRGWTEKIHEINKKYGKPRITMSPAVRYSLLFLRLYLLLLVVLLGYKFWTMMQSGGI
jgi:hypothetical protein